MGLLGPDGGVAIDQARREIGEGEQGVDVTQPLLLLRANLARGGQLRPAVSRSAVDAPVGDPVDVSARAPRGWWRTPKAITRKATGRWGWPTATITAPKCPAGQGT